MYNVQPTYNEFWQTMSHQVLARKWRPARFTELVGQEHVLQALVNALDRDRLHHAYLFTGTRGVGKTTIARIFARCLNCDTGVTSEPCGTCSACEEINAGSFVDLIEVDAASRTKVEDTRELLENVQYAPTRGRFKVYLIDEVHMLSTHSFNALLKTLEEPPPHVKFLLATTDPQKLPPTILSRCLQFNLKNMSAERIVEHLKHVLSEESVAFEEPALWLLADAAQGSMRDALSLTDQAIAFGAGNLAEEGVRTMLGTIDRQAVQRVLAAVVGGDAKSLLSEIDQLAGMGTDFQALLEDLQGLLHSIALAQVLPEGENNRGDTGQVTSFASQLAPEDVQIYYQIALNGRRDFPYTPDPRRGFEMIALRMLAFRPAQAAQIAPVADGEAEAKKPEGPGLAPQPAAPAGEAVSVAAETKPGPQTPGTGSMGKPTDASAPVEDEQPPFPEPDEMLMSATATESPATQPPSRVQTAKEPDPKETALKETAKVPAQEAPVREKAKPVTAVGIDPKIEPVPDSLEVGQLTGELWCRLLPQLAIKGVARNIAAHSSLVSAGANGLSVVLAEEQVTLFNDDQKAKIERALGEFFGSEVSLDIKPGTLTSETPAEYASRKKAERVETAVQNLKADHNVQMLVNEFGGELVTATVRPID